MSGPYSAQSGHLYGVGFGPDDAGLITPHGVDIIRTANVIAYHAGTHGYSTVRSIAAELTDTRSDATAEEQLRYPVTTGRPADYYEQFTDFYVETAARLHKYLAGERSVAILSLGDPMLCSSHQHLHHALSEDLPTKIVPGMASITTVVAEIGQPLGEIAEIVGIVPTTADSGRIAMVLDVSDCVVIMRLGKNVEKVRTALQAAGMLEHAYVIE